MSALTVYCASSPHLDEVFHEPAQRVGREIARRGLRLVYGGGSIGLMGEVARSVRAHGGKITGVITRHLRDLEQGWDECDEMIVVETMRERKQLMAEHGDAFLILPGGLGTYEEFFEIWTGRLLGEHGKPVGIVNTDRYYDPLIELVRHGIEHRFIKEAVLELLHVDPDPVRVIEMLATESPSGVVDADRFLPMGRQQ